MNRDRSQHLIFLRAHPKGFFVDPTDRTGLERYARRRGWIGRAETLISVAKAGEGNMNLVLRLTTERSSFILKQARPWVEKYPQIDAPAGRARVEGAFYRAVASSPALRTAMPALLDEDETSSVLILEDLGRAQDFTPLYTGSHLSESEMEMLASYLVELHRLAVRTSDLPRGILRNREMRALNHEHIFRLPLAEDNGLSLDDITPGLADAAQALRRHRAYLRRARELGELYLEDGPALVHGDYFPGSWLRTGEGVKVIDPEFCFLGTPAFDLGVLVAHLHLSRQPSAVGENLLESYRLSSGAGTELLAVARQLAGIEIMRRLIGVAQLPRLRANLEEKKNFLELSRELVLSS